MSTQKIPILELTPLHVVTSDRRAWPLSEHKRTWRTFCTAADGWYLVPIGRHPCR